jgi:hypothetical protein
MTNNGTENDRDLNADLVKLRRLYNRLPDDEFSAELEDRVMRIARRHTLFRRLFRYRLWPRFVKGPIVVAIVAALGITVMTFTVQRPAFVQNLLGPGAPTVEEQIDVLVQAATEIEVMQPATAKRRFDDLVQLVGSTEELEQLIDKLENEGATEEAELLRKLLDSELQSK